MNENINPGPVCHPLRKWHPSIRGRAVFLLRHGSIQSDDVAKRFIGQTNLPLNDCGRRQAHYWRNRFVGETLSGIFCSDLNRCTETARVIARESSPPITAMQELREIHLGQWDGLTFDRVRRRWPDAFRQRGQDIVGFRPPGGESFSDLHQRVIPAFEKIVGQTDGNLLVVAHAGVNRVILCHLLGMPADHLFRISQCPGAMNIIERRPDGYRVHLVNHPPQEERIG